MLDYLCAKQTTSLIGWLLYTDQLTRKWGRISFARVFVEVDIIAKPLNVIPAILPDETEVGLLFILNLNLDFA